MLPYYRKMASSHIKLVIVGDHAVGKSSLLKVGYFGKLPEYPNSNFGYGNDAINMEVYGKNVSWITFQLESSSLNSSPVFITDWSGIMGHLWTGWLW